MIRFAVRDTGLGIPPEKQAMLFEKFTQADVSVNRQFGGTGLGLSISKQLAELMGGEIGVTSALAQGSEFWFTARFARPAVAGEPMPSLDLAANLEGVRILIVDDNASFREVLTVQLRAWGMRVEVASTGPSALQKLARASEAGDPFQTAIVDMQMPGMDGAALGRAIRGSSTLKEIRLILLTSLGNSGSGLAVADIGFAACLPKPVRKMELLGSLHGSAPADNRNAEAQPPLRKYNGAARILLAEDNPINQEVAAAMLEKLGLRADMVANGEDALKAISNSAYDLVLMDVQMPVMDGLTAAKEIRKKELEKPHGAQDCFDHSHLPIIAMTANAIQGDREDCLEAGMDDYLQKPVTPQALAAMLAKWLPPEPEGGEAAPQDRGTGILPVRAEKNMGKMPMPLEATEAGASPAIQQESRRDDCSTLPKVWDSAVLLERMSGDEELAKRMLDSFLGLMPQQITVLKKEVAAGDLPASLRQAHSIKGAAANVGGEAMRALAAAMEAAGRAGDLDGIKSRLDGLDQAYALLKAAMVQN